MLGQRQGQGWHRKRFSQTMLPSVILVPIVPVRKCLPAMRLPTMRLPAMRLPAIHPTAGFRNVTVPMPKKMGFSGFKDPMDIHLHQTTPDSKAP